MTDRYILIPPLDPANINREKIEGLDQATLTIDLNRVRESIVWYSQMKRYCEIGLAAAERDADKAEDVDRWRELLASQTNSLEYGIALLAVMNEVKLAKYQGPSHAA